MKSRAFCIAFAWVFLLSATPFLAQDAAGEKGKSRRGGLSRWGASVSLGGRMQEPFLQIFPLVWDRPLPLQRVSGALGYKKPSSMIIFCPQEALWE